MTDITRPTAYCSCGERLYTKTELLYEADSEIDMEAAAMARHIAEAYLCKDSAYCAEEDDVVPREFWKDQPR